MATDAQIRANLENALRSTGPRTVAGRATSSQNAVKHGIFAKNPVAGPEDEQEFQTLIECLESQYRPEGEVEHGLVHHMADARWRYLRCCEEERALYNLDYKQFGASDPAAYDRGAAFIRLMDAKHLQYSRRCQRTFERKYEKALAELRRLQAERRAADREASQNKPGSAKLASFSQIPTARQAPAHNGTPRNAPCPCGSGQKHKRCCGKDAKPHYNI